MKNSLIGYAQVFEWHINDIRPQVKVDQINYIQADGYELYWILRRCIKVPYFNEFVARWYGAITKKIYMALPEKSNS